MGRVTPDRAIEPSTTCAYGREKTPGCDCEQNGQTDPEYHASDCTWRMFLGKSKGLILNKTNATAIEPSTTCAYCGRSQEFGSGSCIGCAGPLPQPEQRVVSRTYDVSRDMIDITSYADTSRAFVPGRTTALLNEQTVERPSFPQNRRVK